MSKPISASGVKSASEPKPDSFPITTLATADSAGRVLAIVLAFTEERPILTTRDLAEVTRIPLPTVYRYVALLRSAGLIYGDERGAYRLSARWVTVARAAEAADPLIDIADPVMHELANETGETVLLVRLIDEDAVCVHRIESSSHSLRIAFTPGERMPLQRGASVRLLLCSLPDATIARHIEALEAIDPELAEKLRQQIPQIREHGWAVSEQEVDAGIWSAAAAIRDGKRTVASISVPSPLVRAPAEIRDQRLKQVRAAAAEISRRAFP